MSVLSSLNRRRLGVVLLLIACAAGILGVARLAQSNPAASPTTSARGASESARLASDSVIDSAADGSIDEPTGGARFPAWRVAGAAIPGEQAPLRNPWPRETTSSRIERAWALELPPGQAEVWRAVQPGAMVEFPLGDGRVLHGTVNLVQRDAPAGAERTVVAGALEGSLPGGSFDLGITAGRIAGTLLPHPGEMAYVLLSGREGGAYLAEKRREYVLCTELPGAEGVVRPPRPLRAGILRAALDGAVTGASSGPTSGQTAAATTAGGNTGVAESGPLPESQRLAVLYLDFDGEIVIDPAWNKGNPINAAPANLTATQIEEVIRRVQEEFRPFRIEVTTSLAAYQAAPVTKRMRCIITNSSAWYAEPWVGGVARTFSWSHAGVEERSTTVPCWAFCNNLSNFPQYVADVIAHEAGHTLGLAHDGLRSIGSPATTAAYYEGRGSGVTGWAPIMGTAYYQPVSQWSNGDYAASASTVANNPEDDLTIIASPNNHTGHVEDTIGNTSAEAALLLPSTTPTVNFTSALDRGGDVDFFYFAATGTITLAVANDTAGTSEANRPNLDAALTLYNSAGTQVMQANPTGSLHPSLSYATPAPGIYAVRVSAAGEPTMPITGFSTYGSLGRYRLSGTVTAPAAGTLAPVIRDRARRTLRQGAVFAWTVEASGAPTAFTATGLPDGLTLDPATGAITGTPAGHGSFSVVLSATNAAGTGTRTVTFNVLPAALTDASAPPGLVFTSGGDEPWEIVDDFVHDGPAAIRSGQLMHNLKQSWIETTVTGPGIVKFWWRVSSEAACDFLRFDLDPVLAPVAFVDNPSAHQIAGQVEWTERTVSIPAGTHTLRWTYWKDQYLSEGLDQAWVDGVRWIPPPTITGPVTARAIAGVPATIPVATTHAPTTYAAGGLPAGLTIDPATGVISGTPAALGVFPVNLTVSNEAGSDDAALSLSVVTAFAAWAEDASLTGSDALASADPEADGRPNLVEYALGLDPLAADPPGATLLPVIALVPAAGGGQQLEIAFTIPPARPDVSYVVEVTGSLSGTWLAGHAYGPGTSNGPGLPTTEVEHTTLADGSQQIRVRDATTTSGGTVRFIRLRIEQL